MADQTPELHICALGPPEVHLGEHLVTFPTRKTLALLIYLAIEVDLQPRDHLAPGLAPFNIRTVQSRILAENQKILSGSPVK
jgi:hypothetical protein